MFISDEIKLVNASKKSTSPKGFRLPKPKDEIDQAIQAFLNNRTGKFGKYISTTNALVYRTVITERGDDVSVSQNIIAIRIERPRETLYIGNSSVLPLIGRTVSFGRERLNRDRSEVQERLSSFIPMIPFSVFSEAGLSLSKLNIIERGSEEKVTRTDLVFNSKTGKQDKIYSDVHYTGASLFEVEGRTFLFDIDRREIKHKIFNAFLVELNSPVRTIQDAYESLKPDEVKKAESSGLKVLRQGEWFFIPVAGDFSPTESQNRRFNNSPFERLELRAGNNRPNYAQKYARFNSKRVVSGRIEHSGREHADLELRGWYLPVPNTSVQSFTLIGDVD